jgi:hypothetical protein
MQEPTSPSQTGVRWAALLSAEHERWQLRRRAALGQAAPGRAVPCCRAGCGAVRPLGRADGEPCGRCRAGPLWSAGHRGGLSTSVRPAVRSR